MTTSLSPLRVLKGQADRIAQKLKAIARGEDPAANDPKIIEAKKAGTFKVGVVMDDKVITLEIPWATIEQTGEVALSEYILRLMKGERDKLH